MPEPMSKEGAAVSEPASEGRSATAPESVSEERSATAPESVSEEGSAAAPESASREETATEIYSLSGVKENNQTEIQDSEESEYANLAIAQVNHYVNVRKEPNTDSEILGKIYNGAVAQILEVAGEEQDWFHVVSGSVEGYIKS
ncbi:MAG: SH3 domain-containing protein, partial [Acetatifactor sp.]|nr:SH3 domain-containing protein [Acetatifactor sp.]